MWRSCMQWPSGPAPRILFMHAALALVLIVLLASGTCSAVSVTAHADASNVVANTTSTFLSTTIEISQLYIDGRLPNTSNPVFRQLGRNLDGVRLRIGGTRGDTFYYDMSAEPVTVPPPPFTAVLNHTMIDWVGEYAAAIGAEIAFGVNGGQGPRTHNGSWTPDNVMPLLSYVQERRYPFSFFEFTNEPNLFPFKFPGFRVSPEQYAADLAVFASTIRSINSSWWVVAADCDYVPIIGDRTELVDYDSKWMKTAGKLVDAYTYHFYPLVNAEKAPNTPPILAATPEKLLEPFVLNRVGKWGAKASKKGEQYAPQAEVWLGETGSAVGGGAPNISNRYVDAFEWQDKLGQLSKLGQATVMRQTLTQSDDGEFYYGLMTYDLVPHPSYYFAALYRQLVGVGAVDVTISGASSRKVRAYAYTLREKTKQCIGLDARDDALALTIANMHQDESATISLDITSAASGVPVQLSRYYSWIMSSKFLTSDSVYLNGASEPLSVNADGTLPRLAPLEQSNPLELAPATYAFVVVTSSEAKLDWSAFPCGLH